MKASEGGVDSLSADFTLFMFLKKAPAKPLQKGRLISDMMFRGQRFIFFMHKQTTTTCLCMRGQQSTPSWWALEPKSVLAWLGLELTVQFGCCLWLSCIFFYFLNTPLHWFEMDSVSSGSEWHNSRLWKHMAAMSRLSSLCHRSRLMWSPGSAVITIKN